FSKFDSNRPEPSELPIQDFVLPSESGKLKVTVVRNGQPVAGGSVALYLENADLLDICPMSTRDATTIAIQDAACPIAKTNAQGVADFENLLPGRYLISATEEAKDVRAALYGVPELRGLTAQSTGISVQVNETTNYKLNLYEQKNSAVFRALQSD